MVVSAGISSGGYTASQLQVVFSKRIKGAGIMIGGPYQSGKYVFKMKDLSWKPEDYNENLKKADELYQLIRQDTLDYEAAAKIDPLTNL